MNSGDVNRRDFLAQSAAAAASLTLLDALVSAQAFPTRPGEEIVPWADQPPVHPNPKAVPKRLRWEDVDSWLTPNDKFFAVGHYGFPAIDARAWALQVTGLVRQPLTLTLDQLKARPRHEVVYTLECSGNDGAGRPGNVGLIGTARWAGTPLAPVLDEAGIRQDGVDVVFYGADNGEEQVGDIKVRAPFARSLSVTFVKNPNLLLCYEMNGGPLPQAHGFPLRLIVPGWYGVANVKWLTRIEVRDTRFEGRFMGRDYVTIREEQFGDQQLAIETSVGRTLLKSAPARVTRVSDQYRILGAAWGGPSPIARVEVAIDNGPWVTATIDRSDEAEFAWRIWSLDWEKPAPGEHRITSRAIDSMGRVQPAPDDPSLTNKRTYWETNGQITRRVRVA